MAEWVIGILVAITWLLGLVAESMGEPALQDSPYRIVRPAGPGPHPAALSVSGCSGFAPHEAPRH